MRVPAADQHMQPILRRWNYFEDSRLVRTNAKIRISPFLRRNLENGGYFRTIFAA